MALVLGCLSARSLIAEMAVWRAQDAIAQLNAGGQPDVGERMAASAANIAAADWFERSRHLAEAARALGGIVSRSAEAATLLRTALAARPGDTRSWSQLAVLQLRTDRLAAARSWTMAVEMAPFEVDQFHARLAIGFALLPTKDRSLVALLAQQVRFTAAALPADLADIAQKAKAESFVYAALLQDEDLRWRFSKARAAIKPSSSSATE